MWLVTLIINIHPINTKYSPAPIEVGFDPDSYTVGESDGSVQVTLRVFSHMYGGAPRPFSVAVNTVDDTASKTTILTCST